MSRLISAKLPNLLARWSPYLQWLLP